MIKRVSGLFVVSLLISIPLFSVLILSFFPEQPVFKHLWETVLPGYLVKTVLLMGGVGLGAFFLGVMTAGLVSFLTFREKALNDQRSIYRRIMGKFTKRRV